MSVIRKKPYIEKIIGRLTPDEMAEVLSVVNNDDGNFEVYKSLVDPNYHSFTTLSGDNPFEVYAVRLQMDAQKIRNGIFIRLYVVGGNPHEDLLVYGESQKITIYRVNTSANTYELVDEYCDINELRNLLVDTAEQTEINTDNVFVNDEFEMKNTASFGENAVAKIQEIAGGGGGTQLYRHELYTLSYISTSPQALTVDNTDPSSLFAYYQTLNNALIQYFNGLLILNVESFDGSSTFKVHFCDVDGTLITVPTSVPSGTEMVTEL